MEFRDFSNQPAELVTPIPSEKASISIVGLGYVGAVSTACLAALGHRVIGVDLDLGKVAQIGRGKSPIHEADLSETLTQGVKDGLISATDDLTAAVRETDVTFVSVGTPTAADGGCDDTYIRAASRAMGEGLRDKEGFHVFAMRCSIPPGTTMSVMTPILEEVSGKVAGRDFGICFNPEFLREGVAISDFHHPPKTVIGTTDFATAEIMRRIYAPVDDNPILTTIEVAETIKYVDNVWHATKVCFANEVGRLCKPLGVDSHAVMDIFTQDQKLNLSSYYLKPGFAYGGSCLPKEVRAVQYVAQKHGVSLPMIGNLESSNAEQINRAVEMALATGARRVGVLGLAFKPGTDDLRESPILEAMATLQGQGVELLAHDAAVTKDTPLEGLASYTKHGSQGLATLSAQLKDMLCDDIDHLMRSVDAVIVCHASDTYREAVTRHPDIEVIDVVRLFDTAPRNIAVNGIGW
ncbi:UDP-glucose/GDP-mannose dehydrogenase family protein [Shimia sp. R9_1]|uniref:nucleotide sugar dehydrogenase n=1 Tax=Shimia sp. R9_1 TaxID=2821111 RepID=UPI001ADBB44A|nr:nucleotide sugar dehydrogenase [Shimia sp. R9_1]MBO9406539.1 UDP-glucose/GDP-mannose dehydrogenase family protein [Shimia sp. R9_1]